MNNFLPVTTFFVYDKIMASLVCEIRFSFYVHAIVIVLDRLISHPPGKRCLSNFVYVMLTSTEIRDGRSKTKCRPVSRTARNERI